MPYIRSISVYQQKSPLLIKKKNNQNNMHTCFEKHLRSIHMHVCHTYCQFQYISKTKSPFANIQASFDKQRDIRTISRDIRTISQKTGVFCYFFLVGSCVYQMRSVYQQKSPTHIRSNSQGKGRSFACVCVDVCMYICICAHI